MDREKRVQILMIGRRIDGEDYDVVYNQSMLSNLLSSKKVIDAEFEDIPNKVADDCHIHSSNEYDADCVLCNPIWDWRYCNNCSKSHCVCIDDFKCCYCYDTERRVHVI